DVVGALERRAGFLVHPAAEMLPMMSDPEIDELAADIQANGLIEPILYWCDNTAQKETGQHWGPKYCRQYLLDGRSRVAALNRLGWPLEDQRCRPQLIGASHDRNRFRPCRETGDNCHDRAARAAQCR